MVEIVMIINNYTVMENKKSDKYVQKNFNFLWSNISLNCNKKGSEFRNQNVMQSWVHLEASIIFALQMTYILYDHMIYLMPLNEHIGYGQIFLFLIAIQNVWYMIFLFYMLLLLLLLCLQRVHERFSTNTYTCKLYPYKIRSIVRVQWESPRTILKPWCDGMR